MEQKNIFSAKRTAGILFILVGFLYLLSNYQILPDGIMGFIFSWQTVLIIAGLFFLSNRTNKSAGITLILIGTVYMLRDAFPDLLTSQFIWSVMLITAGLFLLFQRRRDQYPDSHFSPDPRAPEADTIMETAFFGGGKRFISTNNFKGGSVTAVFGASEIDLSACSLSAGENLLEINAIFGGIEIRVPSEWRIVVDVTSFFGGFSDAQQHISGINYTQNSVLKISGAVVFGGGKILRK